MKNFDNNIETATIEIENNLILSRFVGEFDQNLAVLEEYLKVKITPKGNYLQISGPKKYLKNSLKVIEKLHDLALIDKEITKELIINTIKYSPKPSSNRAEITNDNNGLKNLHHLFINTKLRTIEPRSHNQAKYFKKIQENTLLFVTGPSGTGKTYIAIAAAVEALIKGSVDKIILSRPAIEAGESLGFLPGNIQEKVDPYLRPLYDALYDCLPAKQVDSALENKQIEIAPLAYMRGRTLSQAFVILDEAQNCTQTQLKMFLTRIGEGSQMIITGDPSQIDLLSGNKSGLMDAVNLLSPIKEVGHCKFGKEDVVRHSLVTKIVSYYEKFEKANRNKK